MQYGFTWMSFSVYHNMLSQLQLETFYYQQKLAKPAFSLAMDQKLVKLDLD